MKSVAAILFASLATATEYGYGKPSSTSKLGYTTVYPGHKKHPVTVTSQYQAVPTYITEHSTGKWSEYKWVSTVLTDCEGKKTTVTSTGDEVMVYHTKTTYTHTSTIYPSAAPTGTYPYAKNATTKVWYELYEEIHDVPYKELGPSALPGYPGSGLYTKWNPKAEYNYQPVEVKKYEGGKWHYYMYTYTYGVPKPSTTTFSAPGTYTVPAYEVTIYSTATAAYEDTCTAKAGETVSYGGYSTTVTKPTTITYPYGAYETHGHKTVPVVKYSTVACSHAGEYTIIKPTVTVYKTETTIVYPTATVYPPGHYHHSSETVTVTKSGEKYTCTAENTSTYTPPSYPTGKHTPTGPSAPGPSDSYEATESYGHAEAGYYVKRGGMLQRRKAEEAAVKKAAPGKRVILV